MKSIEEIIDNNTQYLIKTNIVINFDTVLVDVPNLTEELKARDAELIREFSHFVPATIKIDGVLYVSESSLNSFAEEFIKSLEDK